MRHTLLALTLALAPAPLLAQSTLELSQQYSALPAVQEMMAAMFSPDATAAQLAATLPPGMVLNEGQMDRLAGIVSEELIGFQPRLEALMIDAMADTFTVAELEAQIEWASSDVGRSVLVQTQPLMARIMGEMAPELQTRMLGRQAEIVEVISNP